MATFECAAEVGGLDRRSDRAIPGLLLLAAELTALAAVGFVVARVVLRQSRRPGGVWPRVLAVGLALWGLCTNFVLYVVPGLAGAALGWSDHARPGRRPGVAGASRHTPAAAGGRGLRRGGPGRSCGRRSPAAS